ncbi:hypothetical protein KR51_00020780 [Rubidibacter lacunae KORDI 51-2]|uniref:Uncharacterized protein n=1 Tax=Rubidibacter lacunae KORDI 51-2 TaxID=582515 RepID=U5DLN9_9CHRO|nr:hypothetical protein KR51_00020780 [Rubidibacter lacunae KORDI 51-2]
MRDNKASRKRIGRERSTGLLSGFRKLSESNGNTGKVFVKGNEASPQQEFSPRFTSSHTTELFAQFLAFAIVSLSLRLFPFQKGYRFKIGYFFRNHLKRSGWYQITPAV